VGALREAVCPFPELGVVLGMGEELGPFGQGQVDLVKIASEAIDSVVTDQHVPHALGILVKAILNLDSV